MKLTAILLLATLISSQAQILYDIDKSFKGFIVDRDVNVFDDNKTTWFIPSHKDVEKAEELLSLKLNELNQGISSDKFCPDIERNLRKYTRQYIGYTNLSGDKIILINMLWRKGLDTNGLKSEYVLVLDGCSHYWRVKVNLNTENVYDLDINGNS